MRIYIKYIFILFCIAFTQPFQTGLAQVRHTKQHLSARDSLRMRVLRRDSILRSYRHGKVSENVFLGKVEDYATSYEENNADLNKGFDTTDVSQELPFLEKRVITMRTTIGNSTTLTNLVTYRSIIDHLKAQLNDWEDHINNNINVIDKIHTQIAAFRSDTALRTVPADSSLRQRHLMQVTELEKKWGILDRNVETASIRIGLLDNRVSTLSIFLIDLDNKIDLKIHQYNVKALSNEEGFLWDMHSASGNFSSAIINTVHFNSVLYKYFLITATNFYAHIGSVIFAIAFFCWLYIIKRKTVKVNEDYINIFNQTRFIVKYPLLSTGVATCLVTPYFYDHPVQVFSHTMLLVMMVCCGVLVKKNWPKFLFNFWILLFAAAAISCLSSLLVMFTYADRFIMLIVSVILIFQSVVLLKKVKSSPNDLPPFLQIIIQIFIAVHGVAIILNILGRFSLSKIIGITATLNICLAFGFYVLLQIVMEALFLQLEANKTANDDTLTSYLDFKAVRKKSKDIIIKILFVLWCIALAKNLTIDDYLYDQVTDFLNHPYKISSTAFTFRSVFVFVFVIWVSGLLARVISYLYDFTGQQVKLTPQAKKTRSSILLIRLTVFVVGFFIAVTAAGIPMDRVTIIIGALGVGIGFGLQNIVNNLVSGVILAFEKPVQIGDIIEVSGKSGVIKEIGIRSSRLECGDGSELILPNGDLISQHVINWTLNNNNRRVELTIRVTYGSDVAKVQDILTSVITTHPDIMQTPAPSVFLNNFSDSAVEFRIWFWAAEITKWLSLKSSVMSTIYVEFDKEGIQIPQSQKEVYIQLPVESPLNKPSN